MSCSVVSDGRPSESSRRQSIVCGIAVPMSTSLMHGIGLPARMILPSSSGIGKRAVEPIAPSAKSDAAQECARPCWYCTPTEVRPKRCVKRAMAIIIAHCSSTWSRVSSLAGSLPNSNFMPLASYHCKHSSPQRLGHLGHFDEQRRLRQAFHRHADVDQCLLREDAVDHAHAEAVEEAHDLLVAQHELADLLADCPGWRLARRMGRVDGVQVRGVVLDFATLQPGFEALEEELVVELARPQARIGFAQAVQRAGHAQHADEARPGAVEVGQQQHRPFMFGQARREVVRNTARRSAARSPAPAGRSSRTGRCLRAGC